VDERWSREEIGSGKDGLTAFECQHNREGVVRGRTLGSTIDQAGTEDRVFDAGGPQYILAREFRAAVIINRMRRIGLGVGCSRAIEDKIGRDVDDPRIDLTGNLREMLDTGHIRPPGDLALHLRVIYLNKPSAIDNGIRLCGVD